MESVIEDSIFSSNSSLMNYFDLSEKASDCLIFRKFEECLRICHRGVAKAKNSEELYGLYGATESIETLCIVAIQAYAELDRWKEVLPFILQVYGQIELCPVKLIQLCLLLHAHVEDYTTCSAIITVWLQSYNQQNQQDYIRLIEIYIYQVLVPQKRFKDIQPFLSSCSHLDAAVKEEISESCRRILFGEDGDECDVTRDPHQSGVVQTQEPQEKLKTMSLPQVSTDHLKNVTSKVPLFLISSILAVILIYAIKKKGHNLSYFFSPWSKLTNAVLKLSSSIG